MPRDGAVPVSDRRRDVRVLGDRGALGAIAAALTGAQSAGLRRERSAFPRAFRLSRRSHFAACARAALAAFAAFFSVVLPSIVTFSSERCRGTEDAVPFSSSKSQPTNSPRQPR